MKVIWHTTLLGAWQKYDNKDKIKIYYDNVKSSATYMTTETLLWQQKTLYDKFLSSLHGLTRNWCTYVAGQADVMLMSFRVHATILTSILNT